MNKLNKDALYERLFNEYFFGKSDHCIMVELKFKANNDDIFFDDSTFFNIFKDGSTDTDPDDYNQFKCHYSVENKKLDHTVVFMPTVQDGDKIKILIRGTNKVTDIISDNEENITETNYHHKLLLDQDTWYILNIIYPVSYSAPVIRVYKSNKDLTYHPLYPLYSIEKFMEYKNTKDTDDSCVYNSLEDSKIDTKKTVIKTVKDSKSVSPLSVLGMTEKIFDESIACRENITYNENNEVVEYFNQDTNIHMKHIICDDKDNHVIETVYCNDILISYLESYKEGNSYHSINHLDYYCHHMILSVDDSAITTIKIDMDGNTEKIINRKSLYSSATHEFYKDESVEKENIYVINSDNGDIVHFVDYGIYKVYSKINNNGEKTDSVNNILTFKKDVDKLISVVYFEPDNTKSIYYDSKGEIAFTNSINKDGSSTSFKANNYSCNMKTYRSENGSLYEYEDSDFMLEMYGDGAVEKFKSILYGDIAPKNIYMRDIFGIPRLFHKEY